MKWKDQKKLHKLYKKYLIDSDNQYNIFEYFVDIDYTKQQNLQPKKDEEDLKCSYKVSFKNEILVDNHQLFLSESYSYMDPDIELFNQDKQIYEKHLQKEKNRINKVNNYVYEQLKQFPDVIEQQSFFELKKNRYSVLTLEKYLSSIKNVNQNYEAYTFLNLKIQKEEERNLIAKILHIPKKENVRNKNNWMLIGE